MWTHAIRAAAFMCALGIGRHQMAPGAAPADAEVRALSRRVDEVIDKQLHNVRITPAPIIGDPQFFRRVCLDLTGRVPGLLDIRDFLDDPNPDKRFVWTKDLLQGDRSASHLADVLAARLFAFAGNEGKWMVLSDLRAEFQDWLFTRLQKNPSYDRLVRELLTCDLDWWDDKSSARAFYAAYHQKPEDIAGVTARVFLGLDLECARCHRPPVSKWTATQLWEMAAFFDGVPLRGGTDRSLGREITIPGTRQIVKARFPTGQEPVWKKGLDGRNALANWITAKENPYFAKAAVDLVWDSIFQVSLLDPGLPGDVRVMHEKLLELLATEFASHGHDLSFLLRVVVDTRAYQRGSTAGKSSADDLLPYSRMPVRELSPEQVFDSFAEATDYKEPPPHSLRWGRPREIVRSPRLTFLRQFTREGERSGRPATVLRELLKTKGSFFAKRLTLDLTMNFEKLAGLSDVDRQRINLSLHTLAIPQKNFQRSLPTRLESVYLMALSRPPTARELEDRVRYVKGGGPSGDSRQAIADVCTELLASDEFLRNH